MDNPLPISTRTLRCANAHIYLLMAFSGIGAYAYCIVGGRLQEPLYLALAGAAVLLAFVWALHYTLLSYRLSPEGITRRGLTGSTTRSWHELKAAHAQQQEAGGIISCCVVLTFSDTEWSISSELFSPDEVQELSAQLVESGILTAGQNLKQH